MHRAEAGTDDTRHRLKASAASRGTVGGDPVTATDRRLRQQLIGVELRAELRPDEGDWLEADLG